MIYIREEGFEKGKPGPKRVGRKRSQQMSSPRGQLGWVGKEGGFVLNLRPRWVALKIYIPLPMQTKRQSQSQLQTTHGYGTNQGSLQPQVFSAAMLVVV